MKKTAAAVFLSILLAALLLISGLGGGTLAHAADSQARTQAEAAQVALSEAELLDKLKGSWVGQMAGVTWGAPTEFRYQGSIMPDDHVPTWHPFLINDAFDQDDIYVEIPFLDAMSRYGVDCDLAHLANAFRDSEFQLWHANMYGRQNLRNGIAAPDSGSYLYNPHYDDIDWQIEADFVGQLCPGLVNEAIRLSFDIGHIMNYGDGVYGGVFVAAMHAKAYTAASLRDVLEAGRLSVPEGSPFRALIDDVFTWHEAGKTWQETWQYLEDTYAADDVCPECAHHPMNIDAKLNAGYVLIGLLYGEGDFEQTMRIAMRCGQDSDCNPSTAAAILGNFYGYSGIPDTWKEALDETGRLFSYTEYTFADAVAQNGKLAREMLAKNGVSLVNGIYTFSADEPIIPAALELPGPAVTVTAQADQMLVSLTAAGTHAAGIKAYTWDFGDGQTGDGAAVTHTYPEPGLFTVTCTVTAADNSVGRKTFVVAADYNLAAQATPLVSVTTPAGGGSKELDLIRDGVFVLPNQGGSDMQYDTYTGKYVTSGYVGYTFDKEHAFHKIYFQEGGHFHDGGWFKNGSLSVQVQQNGEWIDVPATLSPVYPQSDDQAAFGAGFEFYTFTFAPVMGDGIRLYGTPGGSASFFSVAELMVIEAADANTGGGEQANEAIPAVREPARQITGIRLSVLLTAVGAVILAAAAALGIFLLFRRAAKK